ncbi:hypothetical protein BU16DRAFT_511291 [Lophium mytilinum]|uniref:Uncharacterized protein n=1 Tax=Lophium mytilinum TaxID=390894 RepID=A0A6A6QRE9_9PEZI|nr:hypothetical protein BU16DRAFT_511291 [Lophium mytilinum]
MPPQHILLLALFLYLSFSFAKPLEQPFPVTRPEDVYGPPPPPSLWPVRSNKSCTAYSKSQPNPLAKQYFDRRITGTINGTLAVLPIPLSLARSIIPSKYTILTSAIQAELPDFPLDKYPCLFQASYYHDISSVLNPGSVPQTAVPDFSSASIEFPFVDLLGDNSTSFRWVPEILKTITASKIPAITEAREFGTDIHDAVFEPNCEAYHREPDSDYTTTFGRSVDLRVVGHMSADVYSRFKPLGSGPYHMRFWKNVTNQPSSANGRRCDEMVRLFNTSVSTGHYQPVEVNGQVNARLKTFKGEKVWEDVWGIRTDPSFVGNNPLDCESLRGYGART